MAEGLGKMKEDAGACKVRLELLATEVTVRSLRPKLRMFHNLTVFGSLIRKGDYRVIKKI